MELSIHALRDRLDSFLFELGSLQFRYGAGLTSSLPISAIYADYPELSRAETFVAIREAANKTSTDERERGRLRLLLEFIAGQVEDAISADAMEEIARTEAEGSISIPESIPLRDAFAQQT